MKILGRIITIVLSASLLVGCAGEPSLTSEEPKQTESSSTSLAKMPMSEKPSRAEVGLYILPDQAFKADRLKDATDNILDGTRGIDNLILYVHGRGCEGEGEPTKSLQDVMPLLESDYTSRVLMFYWPGSDNGCPDSFPDDRAKAAASMFARVLNDLQAYKRDNKAKLSGVKLTLLLHSMGNNVFEAFLRSYQEKSLEPDLFDTIVLNSSATESRSHDVWLRQLDFSPNVYVTVNNHDLVLRGAGFRNLSARLGRSLETTGVRPVPLTKNAIYVDFTDTGVNHRYFISSGQKHNSFLKQFYDAVMNGKAFEFAGYDGIKKTKTRDGATIYYFKKG